MTQSADIFQIRGVNASLKIDGQEFPFADPPYLEKIKLQRKHKEAQEQYLNGEMSTEDWLEKVYEFNKESIKQYLPTLTDKVLDKLGEFAFQALVTKVQELTQTLFGAVVEKVEKK